MVSHFHQPGFYHHAGETDDQHGVNGKRIDGGDNRLFTDQGGLLRAVEVYEQVRSHVDTEKAHQDG